MHDSKSGLLLGLAVLAALALCPSPASADDTLADFLKGTPEEEKACTPDALRLCKEAIPDKFRVLACLMENRTKLANACRQVLEDHGK